MKTMFLATAAVLLVGAAGAHAAVTGGRVVQAAAAAHDSSRSAPRSVQTARPWTDNPTDLPSYEMRPDGLMINGPLPANGWQG